MAPKKLVILLLDNLSAHHDTESIAFALNNGIHIVFFPANVSHFMQPCDDLVFANFKNSIKSKLQQELILNSRRDNNIGDVLCTLAQESTGSITEKVIKTSFEHVGLAPWSPDKILQNAKSNISEQTQENSDTVTRSFKAVVDLLKKDEDSKSRKKTKYKPRHHGFQTGHSILMEHDEQAKLKMDKEKTKNEKKKLAAELKLVYSVNS